MRTPYTSCCGAGFATALGVSVCCSSFCLMGKHAHAEDGLLPFPGQETVFGLLPNGQICACRRGQLGRLQPNGQLAQEAASNHLWPESAASQSPFKATRHQDAPSEPLDTCTGAHSCFTCPNKMSTHLHLDLDLPPFVRMLELLCRFLTSFQPC